MEFLPLLLRSLVAHWEEHWAAVRRTFGRALDGMFRLWLRSAFFA